VRQDTVFAASPALPSVASAPSTSIASSRLRLLPRDRVRGGRDLHLRRRQRPRGLSRVAEAGRRAIRMAVARLVLDGNALSPADRSAPGAAFGRNAPARRSLRPAFQPPARPQGTSVRGALQDVAGRGRAALPGDGELHPRQPGSGQPAPRPARLALELAAFRAAGSGLSGRGS